MNTRARWLALTLMLVLTTSSVTFSRGETRSDELLRLFYQVLGTTERREFPSVDNRIEWVTRSSRSFYYRNAVDHQEFWLDRVTGALTQVTFDRKVVPPDRAYLRTRLERLVRRYPPPSPTGSRYVHF